MATVSSLVSGPWSSLATWGLAIPQPGDDVVITAGTTVTLDVDVTVKSLTFSGPTSKIAVTAAHTMIVTGNVSAAASTVTAIGFECTAGFTLQVLGTIRTLNTNCRVVYVNTTAPVIVSAASIQGATGGTVGAIIHVAGAGAVVSYTGKCFTATGATAATVIVAGSGATMTIHGDLDNELTIATGYNVRMQTAASTLIVDGDVLGRSGARAPVSIEVAGCTVTARDAVASTVTYAIGVSAAGLAPVVNLRSCMSPSSFPAVYAPAGRLNISGGVTAAANGQLPFNTASLFVSEDAEITIPTAARGWTTLARQAVTGGPEPEDVRAGLIYGSSEGECVIPSPNAVSIGAVVDGSSGLAALLPQQFAAVSGAQFSAAIGGR